jgi:hypothetical protein
MYIYICILAIPLEIPGPPSSVVAIALSGSEVEVFFTPPAGNTIGITSYTGNLYITLTLYLVICNDHLYI